MSKNLNAGHRKRLRDRFFISHESMCDYELLEMLLFASNARQDTRTLAKELIASFGNLKSVLEANIDELRLFNNMGLANAVSIKCVKEVADRLLKMKIIKKSIKLSNLDIIEKYCISAIGHENVENIYLGNILMCFPDKYFVELI